MSIIIHGVDMPGKHFIDGFYIDGDNGDVTNLSRTRVIGKAEQLYEKCEKDRQTLQEGEYDG